MNGTVGAGCGVRGAGVGVPGLVRGREEGPRDDGQAR
jgi:hypothetical protein